MVQRNNGAIADVFRHFCASIGPAGVATWAARPCASLRAVGCMEGAVCTLTDMESVMQRAEAFLASRLGWALRPTSRDADDASETKPVAGALAEKTRGTCCGQPSDRLFRRELGPWAEPGSRLLAARIGAKTRGAIRESNGRGGGASPHRGPAAKIAKRQNQPRRGRTRLPYRGGVAFRPGVWHGGCLEYPAQV